jgi:hypothetical protein
MVALTVFSLLPSINRAILAQATTGAIKGTVADQQGGVIQGAKVVVRNQTTNVKGPVFATTASGVYVIPNLNPGRYDVTVESGGFKRKVYTDIEVRLGLDSILDVTLEAGVIEETVTVRASGLADGGIVIVKDSPQISESFDSKRVTDLPSNVAGAGLDTLALLIPGVTPGFGLVNSNGTPISVNGNRATSNNFNIDGQDNNDQFLGGQVFFVDNPDLVADYQIITSNFAAQYGRNLGAVVNIVTKSGTSTFHGSGFYFHRDRKLFDTLTNIERRDGKEEAPPSLYNVFGGTLGGPIVRDKAFFFVSYQGVTTRETLTIRSGLAILPEELPRLKAAFPGNAAIAALADFSPFAITDLGAVRQRTDFIGTVRIGNQPFRAAFVEREFPFSDATPYSQNEFSVRTDFKLTDKDDIWVRYLFQDVVFKNFLGQFGGSTFAPTALAGGKGGETSEPSDTSSGKLGFGNFNGSNGFTGDFSYRSNHLGGTWNRQLSSFAVNEFSAAYSRVINMFGGGCEGRKGCIPEPEDATSGLTSIFAFLPGSLLKAGPPTNFPRGNQSEVLQFRDNLLLRAYTKTLNQAEDASL